MSGEKYISMKEYGQSCKLTICQIRSIQAKVKYSLYAIFAI